MGVENTTETALKSLVRNAIRGISPTAAAYTSEKWVEGKRPKSRAGLKTRRYTVRFRNMTDGPEGAPGWTTTGQSQDVSVVVETHYAVGDGVMPLVMQDHRDLRDTLSRLKHTAANGIWFVESEGHEDPPESDDDESMDQWVCRHQFLIRYQVARSYT